MLGSVLLRSGDGRRTIRVTSLARASLDRVARSERRRTMSRRLLVSARLHRPSYKNVDGPCCRSVAHPEKAREISGKSAWNESRGRWYICARRGRSARAGFQDTGWSEGGHSFRAASPRRLHARTRQTLRGLVGSSVEVSFPMDGGLFSVVVSFERIVSR